eukprot:TRINITY_DN6144_c0_g1_i1.p2 TRINITY_DN6144_c0_g1~~TRINITY_DN6144_c0_g1_i1.p2  ORF type:complete len:261 (+),score=33.71 TRINITY_DN6144_c0_g1_i1:64-846(+)
MPSRAFSVSYFLFSYLSLFLTFFFFFFNDTATTEIYTLHIVGSVRCVQETDVMEENCVKEFYNTIKNNSEVGLIHFNISCLNDSTKEVKLLPLFPKKCSTQFYIEEKLKGNIISFVVEFIVRRDIFYSCGRFQNYDLAWGSDFISWIKFSDVANGIVTCDDAKVQWRKSNENISPNKDNPILYRKIVSIINYTKWILDFTVKNKYERKILYTKFPLGEIVRCRHLLTEDQKITLVNLYISVMKPSFVFKFLITCFKLFIQ